MVRHFDTGLFLEPSVTQVSDSHLGKMNETDFSLLKVIQVGSYVLTIQEFEERITSTELALR